MAALAPTGLCPAPRALLRRGSSTCLLYRYAEGQRADGLAPDLAAALADVHALAPRVRARLRPRPLLFAPLLAEGLAYLARHGLHMAKITHEVATALATDAPPPRLVHGDPVPANLIHTPRGLVLIDWHCAHLGDPVRDLAIATSPAMHLAYGSTPPDPRAVAAFHAAYGCGETVDRALRLAPALHVQMIGQCVWQGRHAPHRGDQTTAIAAEIAALRSAL